MFNASVVQGARVWICIASQFNLRFALFMVDDIHHLKKLLHLYSFRPISTRARAYRRPATNPERRSPRPRSPADRPVKPRQRPDKNVYNDQRAINARSKNGDVV
jgi:hypothetical protein